MARCPRGNGLAPQAFFDLITGTLFEGLVYRGYAARIVSGDFNAGFRMNLGLKDLRLAAAAGEKAGQALPVLDALRARMAEAVEAGMGNMDWSGIADYTLTRTRHG